jgi:hypothetical protein
MSEPSIEAEGAPAEEELSPAKVKEQLDTDPDQVANAPNRNPAESPHERPTDTRRRSGEADEDDTG